MRGAFFAFGSLALAASLASGAQLGVNIDLPERGGTYIDVARENWRWVSLKTGKELARDEADEAGWPRVDARFVVDWRPVAEWAGAIDDPEAYRLDVSGTYRCSFRGSAELRSGGDGSVSRLKELPGGLSSFDLVLPPGSKGLVVLEFRKTRRHAGAPPGSGLTGLRMLRPGFEDDPGLFHPALLSALAGVGFSVIRFMNFTRTNGADPPYPAKTLWKDRKTPTDASQAPIPARGKLGGASWEQVAQLAQLAKADPWINVPLSADADYLDRLAAFWRGALPPGRALYVESSNEVWNTAPGFPQSAYNRAQAKALGLGEHENHARRSVELAKAFEREFGHGSLNTRVRVVLASHQPMLEWWVEPMLKHVRAKHGEPKTFFWAIASQTYFSGGAQAGEDEAKILADARKDIERQLEETGGNKAGRRQWAAKAAAWGLPGGWISYEGGPDHGGGSTVNVAARIRAERSSGMAELMRHNLWDRFFKLGGTLAMQFTLSSAYNRYGCWGLTDDIRKPERSAKYAALARLNRELSAEPGPGRQAR